MKELIKIFITQGIPLLSLGDIEEYIDDWFKVDAKEDLKNLVLVNLINQKLLRNEQEY